MKHIIAFISYITFAFTCNASHNLIDQVASEKNQSFQVSPVVANVKWKYELRKTFENIYALSLNRNFPLPNSWVEDNGFFINSPHINDKYNSIILNATSKSFQNNLKIAPYNKIYVEYERIPDEYLCKFKLKFMSKFKDGTNFNVDGWSNDIDESKEHLIDRPILKNWVEKDFRYLIRREIGVAPEGIWHYKRDGSVLIAQSMFNTKINTTSPIFFEVQPGVSLKKVNLKFTAIRDGKSMLLEAVPVGFNTVSGKEGYLIDISSLNKDKSINIFDQIILDEIIVFIDDPQKNITINPIHSIVNFSGNEILSASEHSQNVNITKINKSSKYSIYGIDQNIDRKLSRRMYDLKDLKRIGLESVSDIKIEISGSRKNICAISPTRVVFASEHQRSVPAWINYLESRTKDFRGNQTSLDTNHDTVSAIDVFAYESFNSLHARFVDDSLIGKYKIALDSNADDQIRLKKIAPNKINKLWVNKNNNLNDLLLNSSGNVLLSYSGEIPSAVKDSPNTITGTSNRISLIWNVNKDFPYKSQFKLFGFRELVGVSLIKYKIFSNNTVLNEGIIEPGESITLPNRYINKIEIDFIIPDTKYKINLGSLIVYKQKISKLYDAHQIKLPWSGKTNLTPVNTGEGLRTISTEKFIPSGFEHESVKFNLDVPLINLDSIDMSWKIPKDWISKNPCIFKLKFLYQTSSIERQLCTKYSHGFDVLTNHDLGIYKSEKLNALELHVEKPVDSNGILDIKLAATGIAMRSPLAEIFQFPLLQINGSNVYATDKQQIESDIKLYGIKSIDLEVTNSNLMNSLLVASSNDLKIGEFFDVLNILISDNAGNVLKKLDIPRGSSRSIESFTTVILSLVSIFTLVLFIYKINSVNFNIHNFYKIGNVSDFIQLFLIFLTIVFFNYLIYEYGEQNSLLSICALEIVVLTKYVMMYIIDGSKFLKTFISNHIDLSVANFYLLTGLFFLLFLPLLLVLDLILLSNFFATLIILSLAISLIVHVFDLYLKSD